MRFRNTLILFTKTPRICRVKTRMWPTLSHRQCLYFHRQATQHLYQLLSLNNQFNLKIYTTDNIKRIVSFLPKHVEIQQGVDLGERMYRAMQAELKKSDRVAIIGSDCIQVNLNYITAAFNNLQKEKDLVLGAANDGGYVLIGARNVSRALFNNTIWGSSSVLNTTSNNAISLGYNVTVMPELIDADSIEDLQNMHSKKELPPWAISLLPN